MMSFSCVFQVSELMKINDEFLLPFPSFQIEENPSNSSSFSYHFQAFEFIKIDDEFPGNFQASKLRKINVELFCHFKLPNLAKSMMNFCGHFQAIKENQWQVLPVIWMEENQWQIFNTILNIDLGKNWLQKIKC